ncbi:MAG: peptidylprolyl isomerase, partial [Bacteroidota bacterium]
EPFFDGLTFHRVEPGFVIQGGDPLANGMGGPGYKFRQEINPDLKHNVAGTLAMANAGPNTNGSQFYITLAPTPFLDGGYNVFGYVVDGLSVATSIGVGDTIRHIEIIRKGNEARSFKAPQVFKEQQNQ